MVCVQTCPYIRGVRSVARHSGASCSSYRVREPRWPTTNPHGNGDQNTSSSKTDFHKNKAANADAIWAKFSARRGALIFEFPTPSGLRDEGPIAGQELSVVEKSALAVVKLYGCSEAGAETCTSSEGSGTIVHPRGLILTALHVVIEDPENLRSPLLPEISVGMVEELNEPVDARYRANVIAYDSELDLALLSILHNEDEGRLFLPTLPVENIGTREFLTGALRVMGFQQGQSRLKQPSVDYYGTNEDGAVEVDGPLVRRGFSGAPLLVGKEDRYHVGGVVFYKTEGPVLVQPVRGLGGLYWRDTAMRLWAEDVTAESSGVGPLSRMNVTANIHTVDLVGHKLQLVAVAVDPTDEQPWPSVDEPLALQRNFAPERFLDVVPLDLNASLAGRGRCSRPTAL